MQIKKAVITAAGAHQRTLPLQTVVDADGRTKAALAVLLEEAVEAGIAEVCVVLSPGDQRAYQTAAGPHASRVTWVEQAESRGYGHAVWCARGFVGREPFLLLVGDHLYVSGDARRCAAQLVEIALAEDAAVSAVQATHESKLTHYGAVGGRLVGGRSGRTRSPRCSKTTPTEAEQRLPCRLRAGRYSASSACMCCALGARVAGGGPGAGGWGRSRGAQPGARPLGPPRAVPPRSCPAAVTTSA
jgi:UTP--glucose-1-phosphate uridylyltransferase